MDRESPLERYATPMPHPGARTARATGADARAAPARCRGQIERQLTSAMTQHRILIMAVYVEHGKWRSVRSPEGLCRPTLLPDVQRSSVSPLRPSISRSETLVGRSGATAGRSALAQLSVPGRFVTPGSSKRMGLRLQPLSGWRPRMTLHPYAKSTPYTRGAGSSARERRRALPIGPRGRYACPVGRRRVGRIQRVVHERREQLPLPLRVRLELDLTTQTAILPPPRDRLGSGS